MNNSNYHFIVGLVSLLSVAWILAIFDLVWEISAGNQIEFPHAATTSTTSTTSIQTTALLPLPHNFPDKPPKCAINLYGLPRSFKDYVLPSLLENVVRPNARYGCDYFVHYYDVAKEAGGRSGSGGSINPTEILLLKEAVEKIHNKNMDSMNINMSTGTTRSNSESNLEAMPTVQFCSDKEESFRLARNKDINRVLNLNEKRNATDSTSKKNPFMPTGFNQRTLMNILKMWHSQTRVFELMSEHGKRKHKRKRKHKQQHHKISSSSKNSIGSSNTKQQQRPYYDRVAMLRSDVVFMTPVDIFRVTREPLPVLDTTTYVVSGTDYNSNNNNDDRIKAVAAKASREASKAVKGAWDMYQNRPGHNIMNSNASKENKYLPENYDPCDTSTRSSNDRGKKTKHQLLLRF